MDRSNHIPQPIKRVMDPLSTKLKRYELITLIFCNAILHFKMVFITFATAFFRSQEKIPSTPEDAKFYGKFSSESQMFHSISQDSMVARVRRIHQNDIENILSFSFLAFGMYLCDSSISTSVAGIICFLLFTFSRIVFMVMYWGSYQPWRSIFFALGQLTMLVMAVWSVIAVFYNNIW